MLYELLSGVKRDPIVELNKAIAIGFAKSAEEGLTYLKTVKGLESNSLYYAALGDFYEKVGNAKSAGENYTKAISLTQSASEIELLKSKLSMISY